MQNHVVNVRARLPWSRRAVRYFLLLAVRLGILTRDEAVKAFKRWLLNHMRIVYVPQASGGGIPWNTRR